MDLIGKTISIVFDDLKPLIDEIMEARNQKQLICTPCEYIREFSTDRKFIIKSCLAEFHLSEAETRPRTRSRDWATLKFRIALKIYLLFSSGLFRNAEKLIVRLNRPSDAKFSRARAANVSFTLTTAINAFYYRPRCAEGGTLT